MIRIHTVSFGSDLGQSSLTATRSSCYLKCSWLCGFMVWMVLATPLHASTHHVVGTIVAVNLEAAKPNFTVLVDLYNYLGANGDFGRSSFTVSDKVTFILDGKPSTAAEALAVGRAVTVHDYTLVMVSSRPGPDQIVAPVDLDRCVAVLKLPAAVAVEVDTIPLKAKAKDGKTVVEERRYNLVLTLECRDGVVAAGAAFCPDGRGLGLSSAGSHVVDVSKLTYAAGRLGGTAAVRFHTPLGAFNTWLIRDGQKVEEETGSFTLDVALDPAGTVAGTFRGATQGRATEGKVDGWVRATTERFDPGRAMIRFYGMPPHDSLSSQGGDMFLLLGFSGGAMQPDGLFYFQKGGGAPIGRVTGGDLRLDRNRLLGSLTIEKGGVTATLNVENGVLVGNRFLAGAYTVALSDGKTERRSFKGSYLDPGAQPLHAPGRNPDWAAIWPKQQ